MNLISVEKAFELLENIQSAASLKESFDKLCSELSEDEVFNSLINLKCSYSQQPITWKFSCYLFHLLHQIIEKSDINSLDPHQVNLFTEAVHNCEVNSLEICVKKHKSRTTYDTTNQSDSEYEKLKSCLRMFDKFFSVKFIASNPLFQDAQIDYLVGILSVMAIRRNEEDVNEANKLLIQLQSYIGNEQFFQFIMMVRGFQGLSKDFQVQTQIRLFQLIRAENGFLILCKLILRKKSEVDSQTWQKYNLISGILRKSIKNKNFHQRMVNEIFRTLKNCIINNENEIIGACVFVLKDLYSTKDNDIEIYMNQHILGPLNELINPQILLCGSILMEYDEIKSYIGMLYVLFSSSTVVSLPSKILHDHIIAFFNLYSILPDIPERTKLASVILFVMNNFERTDLLTAVRNLRLKDNPNVSKINNRIIFKNHSLQIGEEVTSLADDTESFILLLKNSNNNVLVYEIFICFIKLLGNVQNAGDSIITGYDLEEEELTDVLHSKFYKQLSIIEPLQEMIQWKSLQSQLNEKPKEILDAIIEILRNAKGDDEQIVIIFFSIYKELLCKLRIENERNRMKDEIFKIKEKFKTPKLKEQIEIILSSNEETINVDPSEITYIDAMKLLQSKEIYCKVYGSDSLIKLLKKRDKQAIANRHTVLAVALQNMKEHESYAYLNIIKLLVALSYILETEVIDTLVAEYQNNELQIDERLKFGEVLLKVTEDLGVMAIKFKQQLFNCFLKGTRDSNDEFRTSSLANLGTICKILSYQIHNFFHEMFQQLETVIKCDQYLPSKRAAAMVLSQVLAGMPNLMEFQDFLLPIYHLLKDILGNEMDEQTKLHAQIGLEHLNEKTKDFLNKRPKIHTQKEIKIRLDDQNPNVLNEIKYK